VNIDLNDIIFFIGLASFSYGLWLFNPAISFIATGVIFMSVGYLRAGGD
jgi:hypothetical protein